jgi:rhodanese-related sulfurtransferase
MRFDESSAPRPPEGDRRTSSGKQKWQKWALLIGVPFLILVVIGVATKLMFSAGRTSGVPPVSGVGSPPGNQPHQFSGDHHAPFITLADYKPIYDRHDRNYVLVDTRTAGVRSLKHIPGDIWVPLDDAASTGWKFLERYKGKTLVLYCDCPWQDAAKESAILEAHGWSDNHLRVLHEGIPGWEQAGYPVVPDGDVCSKTEHWPQACGS